VALGDPRRVFAIYAVDDFQTFIVDWATVGLAAAVLADVRARRGTQCFRDERSVERRPVISSRYGVVARPVALLKSRTVAGRRSAPSHASQRSA
jgi:hypothetical protein